MIVTGNHDIAAEVVHQLPHVAQHRGGAVDAGTVERMMEHRHRAARRRLLHGAADKGVLRRRLADRHVRVQHQHRPFGGAEAVIPKAIGATAIAEIGEVRIGGDRRDVIVIARDARIRDLNLPKLGSKQLRNSSIVPLGYARSPASRMSPSKRSKSRDNGPSAGEPHHPVSPRTFTKVDEIPGAGMTGGEVGTPVPVPGGAWPPVVASA